LIDRIAQIVSENESLRREKVDLEKEVSRLRGELVEIGTALGQLTAAPRRRGRPPRVADGAVAAPAAEKRRRKPITDPVLLEKRRQSLEKARASRRAKLDAERAAATA
jgi:hypothetical protein